MNKNAAKKRPKRTQIAVDVRPDVKESFDKIRTITEENQPELLSRLIKNELARLEERPEDVRFGVEEKLEKLVTQMRRDIIRLTNSINESEQQSYIWRKKVRLYVFEQIRNAVFFTLKKILTHHRFCVDFFRHRLGLTSETIEKLNDRSQEYSTKSIAKLLDSTQNEHDCFADWLVTHSDEVTGKPTRTDG